MSKKELEYFLAVLKEVRDSEHSQFKNTKKYIQHGKTSVYRHSVSVAYLSYRLAKKLKLNVNYHALLRGALLHDYFLYDWHDPIPERRLHGFYHPGIALKNAEKHFKLNKTERDIIKHHMFPLTIKPPKSKEAMLVSLVDKYISTVETVKRMPKKRK